MCDNGVSCDCYDQLSRSKDFHANSGHYQIIFNQRLLRFFSGLRVSYFCCFAMWHTYLAFVTIFSLFKLQLRTRSSTLEATKNFIIREKIFFPPIERLNFLWAYCPNTLVDETANATIAPGPMSSNHVTPVDINDIYVTCAHAHQGA